MIVIYHDVGGSYSSCVCANLHINKLIMDMVPTEEEILILPTFDKITKADYGGLLYISTDEFSAKVCAYA